jgi:hypothetical protein
VISGHPLVTAFRKLLAPRPLVLVFPAFHGWWYCADEMPDTFQVLVGVSEELYWDISNTITADTGQSIEQFCDVLFLPSTDTIHTIEHRPPGFPMRGAITRIHLRPKPVTR